MRKLTHTLPLFIAGAIACGPSGPSAEHFRGKDIGGLSDEVLSVAVGPEGGLWIGTSNGIMRKKGGDSKTWWKSWRVTAAAPAGVNAGYFGVMLPTKAVHTGKMGMEARVYKLQDRTTNLREIPLGEPLIGDRIDALHVDKKGNLWVAARDSGILLVEKGTEDLKAHIPFKELGHERATSFAEAPDGTMFIGTFGAGVTVWKDGKVVTHYTPQNSKLRGNGVVRSLAYHPQQGLYMATANKIGGAVVVAGADLRTEGMGVSRLLGTDWQPITAAQMGLKSNEVIKIAVSPQGDVWFLTLEHGASVLRGGTQWVYPPTAGRMAFDVTFFGDSAYLATGHGLSNISL